MNAINKHTITVSFSFDNSDFAKYIIASGGARIINGIYNANNKSAKFAVIPNINRRIIAIGIISTPNIPYK